MNIKNNTFILLILIITLNHAYAKDRDRMNTHDEQLKEMKKRTPGVEPASEKKENTYNFQLSPVEILVDKKDKKKEK